MVNRIPLYLQMFHITVRIYLVVIKDWLCIDVASKYLDIGVGFFYQLHRLQCLSVPEMTPTKLNLRHWKG